MSQRMASPGKCVTATHCGTAIQSTAKLKNGEAENNMAEYSQTPPFIPSRPIAHASRLHESNHR